MGMFDDLIPQPKPDQPPGPYDDLIAAAETKRKAAGLSFEDLIPKQAADRQPVALPARPSAAKTYWDATKGAFTDLMGDVKAGFGDKNPWELFKTESLPAHLVQGIQRKAAEKPDANAELDEEGNPVPTKKPQPPKADQTDPGILADLKALGVSTQEHPGLVIGSLVKSVVADPELLLPWLWEAIPEATAAKVAQAARAMGASADVAKAAAVGGRITGRAAVGGTTSAAIEGADQFSTGQYDAGKVGRAAAEGAAMSIPGRMAGKERVAPAPSAGQAAGEAAAHADAVAAGVADPVAEILHPEDAKKVAQVPQSAEVSLGTTREALAQATAHDPVTPEMIAEVGKEKIQPPGEVKDRVVKAVKQAIVGGAVGAGVGAAIGAENSNTGWETGALIGAGLPLLKARRYMGPDVSALINARNGQVAVVERNIYKFQNQLEKAVPLKADREKLAEMIDHGVEPAIGTPEHEAYTALKDYFRDMGQLAQGAGVVENLRDNYISHIVEEDPTGGSILKQLFGADKGGGTDKGGKAFGKERKYDTFEDLQAALKDSGLRIKTKDASEIAAIYGRAVYKSIADKRLKDGLKAVSLPDGKGLIMAAGEAPRDYEAINNQQMAGVKVHPDIAADLRFVFGSQNANWIYRKAQQLTSITKRIAVSASLFHAKTLADGFVAAGSGNRFTAAHAALKMFKEGGNNDTIDKLLKGGLKVGTPEDVAGHEVQNGLSKLGEAINSRLPLKLTGLGYVAKGLAKIDRAVEKFTFGYLQTGFKLNVAGAEFERLVGKGVDEARAARLASSYANDIFGSLDYYRVATETDSHIMRKIGTAALNQNSRKILQLAMFAPDWTFATFRSMAKALPGGANDAELMQAHRRYLVKSAIYYFTVANSVNYAMSGHSVFENKNPLRVELGDGRTMQFSKHDTEPLAWLQDPIGTGLGKGALIPRHVIKAGDEVADRARKGKAPVSPIEEVGSDVADMAPISLQQFIQQGMSTEEVLSFLGMPVYGKTAEQKAAAKHKVNKKVAESEGVQ